MSYEEWNNFEHRISEVSHLVRDLASGDKAKTDAAMILANRYLEDKSGTITDEELNVEMKVKSDRTVINQKAFDSLGKKTDPDEMDPEAWMSEVSKDADKRAQDRKVRQERANTLKTQAVRAFKRQEYDRALSYYNRAIEQIRDNAHLYINRALTLIKLGKYEKVSQDCEWAIRLNENSLKAHLYKAKAHQMLEQDKEYAETRKELGERFPQHQDLIENYLQKSEDEEDSHCKD